MMQLVTSPPPPPSSPHGGTAAPPSTTSTPASSAVASPAMIRSQRPAPLLLASTSAQSVGAPWSPPPTNSPMSPPTHSVQTGASTFATSSFFGGPPPSTAHASSAFSHGHSSNGSPRGRRGSRGMDARMAMVGQSSFRTHQQSPTIGLASPSTSPFSPATTMPIVRFPHSTLGPMASGGGSTRPGPVSPGSVSLIAVPSLTQSTRTSFQPVQDPRGPSRTQAAGTTPPKRHGSSQRRDQRQHHRSASWCGGDEEDSFAKTPFRFTPTRDCSISPRSTPSPSSIDPYMRGLSPRQPSASPSRGVSRTARASPRAPTPPRFRGDRCDRLRNEVREMLLQSELDNLTAEHVRTLMMDDGTVVPIEAPVKDAAADAEKRADGCFPGDAKVLAKRQTPRTPAVFSPVSCANTA
ncbi:hypothetical protein PTSG_00804 [Salpingoeca rosetta]|uniref:Uncharacterized protein n=1 Tax=Salpingoeca rosetta (strain ATCC 50818 / BSB-021) TaxID=946362 RepID=F2TXI9_SALR5|nr:uncharacterized protein PTSG_00804 [Salpingoeca rosetta]EGD76098.1 hypothetical protein PTSG_00804 [Salpingoeca rosetta]|eukprot:XP_004998273.1 hypothetical protein PTSG_00804 [Salpingoeca rosetta]